MRWNLSVAGLAASWGFISVIVAGVELDAVVLVFFRLSLAALVIGAAAAVARRSDLLRLPERPLRLLVVGGVLAGHWYLFFETIKLSSVAVALLTVYTAPVFLALLAPFFLVERRSRIALLALVPAGAGMALIGLAGEGGRHARPLAVVVGLGAAVSYAGLVIATKRLTLRLPPATIAFWSYLIAALALTPFLATAGRVLPHLGPEALYLGCLGVVFTGLSGFIYISLLRRVTAQAIGILAFLEPVTGALLAWAILGQALGWQVAAGGALVVAAGLVVVLYEPGDASPVEAAALGSAAE